MKVIAQKVFKSNMQTMQNTMVLVDEEYERAVSALLNARAIHFFAVGDANAACQFSMIKFSKLGISCTAYNDVMMQYITAGNMGKGDVAFAVSYEGKSVNVMQAMKTAKENGDTTICITRRNKSPLLRYIDIKLFVSVSDLTVGWDKASRRVAEQFVLDVLYSGFVARSRKDFDNQLKQIQSIIDLNKKTK